MLDLDFSFSSGGRAPAIAVRGGVKRLGIATPAMDSDLAAFACAFAIVGF
jgi:hypothetical protein